ncbi:hypothetical protein E2C01_052369 [Portunus trituberculatus]|uniref:Uncharacterized protein n=1 Tax=Portunus trituberculatus TaxID=210409 RepID=A0A5B7GMU1_PORTR|nr:hypothetical protein [Portunus trituberculatus]
MYADLQAPSAEPHLTVGLPISVEARKFVAAGEACAGDDGEHRWDISGTWEAGGGTDQAWVLARDT